MCVNKVMGTLQKIWANISAELRETLVHSTNHDSGWRCIYKVFVFVKELKCLYANCTGFRKWSNFYLNFLPKTEFLKIWYILITLWKLIKQSFSIFYTQRDEQNWFSHVRLSICLYIRELLPQFLSYSSAILHTSWRSCSFVGTDIGYIFGINYC